MIEVPLTSIQIGKAQTLGTADQTTLLEREWRSGIFKAGINRAVSLCRGGIVGDEQADLAVHGGPDKAVCVYATRHLDSWRSELGLDMAPGAFGENFTVSEITEDDVCIGDAYQCGTAVVEVSQPRQPCWKLARRWNLKALPAFVQKTGRTGWYFRVLVEGEVSAPTDLELISRPHPLWTVARANAVMYNRKSDADLIAELAQIAELSTAWKQSLEQRIHRIERR